jgi:hypothetical protein
MLYLNPPYDIIRGVSVFCDHDPSSCQYYYLPAMPHLTVIDGEAQFSLIEFTGEAGSGGFLNFDCNLGIDPAVEDEIRSTLRSKYHLDKLPNLIPVLVEDGSVRLMILGKKSTEPAPAGGLPMPAPPAPKEADLPDFVLKIDHYAKPALYGDNQASFSVQLDQYGVAIIKESLKGVLQPIGIVYSLDFFGLRPAFNVRVNADWNRVQKHFEDSFSASVFFLSTEVSKVIDKLIEDQVITIEVDTFVPEGEDTANVISDRDKAVNEVKEMIMTTFFKPSINPVQEEKDGWDKFQETAMMLNTLAVSGGWASVATLSRKQVDLTRIDQKSFNFNMSERTTVRRSIYPQAHLQGLTRVLRENGDIKLSDYVKSVNIDDPFFKRRQVTAINRANLDKDSITSLNVLLNYGSQPQNILLDASTPKGSVEWASVLEDNQMKREVAYSYQVTFKDVDSADRPAVLKSPDLSYQGDDLEINPRADGLYQIISVPVTALDFPFASYPHIEVQLRYNDSANQISLKDTLVLSKDHPEDTWPFFLRDRDKNSFEYKIIYRAADNRDVTVDWNSSDQQELLLRDPRPNKRTVTVVPAVSWDMVSMIFADLSYHDETNGVTAEESYTFDKTDQGKLPKRFAVGLADPNQRLVGYTVKYLLTDNSLIELPDSMTLGKEIFLRLDMKGHRVITVRPEQADFTDKKVDHVQVNLSYQDAGNGLSFANAFTFRSQADNGFFEYDYVDAQKRGYSFQVTTVFTDGFSVSRDPETSDQDVLTLKVG